MVPAAVLVSRWDQLLTLASQPKEQHVLLAEQVDDATNGLLSTLSGSALCTAADPGRTGQCPRDLPHPDEQGLSRVPETRNSQGGRLRETGIPVLSTLLCLPMAGLVGFPARVLTLCP